MDCKGVMEIAGQEILVTTTTDGLTQLVEKQAPVKVVVPQQVVVLLDRMLTAVKQWLVGRLLVMLMAVEWQMAEVVLVEVLLVG